jgi:hypothetical protein
MLCGRSVGQVHDHRRQPFDYGGDKVEIQRLKGVGWPMVMRITEVGRIREHDGREALLPERGVVAPSGVRELLSVARHDQWNNREM